MCGEGSYISNRQRSGRKESTKATLIKGHFNHNEFQHEEKENGKQETYLNDNEEYVSMCLAQDIGMPLCPLHKNAL